jgi:hypothetical protein
MKHKGILDEVFAMKVYALPCLPPLHDLSKLLQADPETTSLRATKLRILRLERECCRRCLA